MNRQAVSIWLAIALAVPAVGQTVTYIGAKSDTTGEDGWSYTADDGVATRRGDEGRSRLTSWAARVTTLDSRQNTGSIYFRCVTGAPAAFVDPDEGTGARTGAVGVGDAREFELTITLTNSSGDQFEPDEGNVNMKCTGNSDNRPCNHTGEGRTAPDVFDWSSGIVFDSLTKAAAFVKWVKDSVSSSGSKTLTLTNTNLGATGLSYTMGLRQPPPSASSATAHFVDAATKCADEFEAHGRGAIQQHLPIMSDGYVGPGAME